jgi:hypothetical protein
LPSCSSRPRPREPRRNKTPFAWCRTAIRRGTPGQKGATYYALERQSTRVTTEFVDGNVATAERSLDGDLLTNLRTAAGLDINRVRVNRKGGGAEDAVQYIRPGADPIQAVIDSTAGAAATLDWLNRQSHHFYQDNVTSPSNLRWQNGAIRRSGAAADDDQATEAATVKSIETVWANGLSARTRRVRLKAGRSIRRPTRERRRARHARLERRRRRGRRELLREREDLFVEHAGRHRRADHERASHAAVRRVLFKPDMIWMNLQALGFYEWARSKPAAHTRASACVVKPTLLQRLSNLISPTVHAAGAPDEPGAMTCTGSMVCVSLLLRHPRCVLREVRLRFDVVVGILVELEM